MPQTFAEGTYTGNAGGSAVAFGPAVDFTVQTNYLLFIKDNTQHMVMRWGTMAAGAVKNASGATALATGLIDPKVSGFEVRNGVTDARVNANGITFRWAVLYGTGDCGGATFAGDGTDNRNVAIAGLATSTPDVAFIAGEAAIAPWWRTSTMSGDLSQPLSATALSANGIQALNAGGIQVGTNAAVNASGDTYHVYAARASDIVAVQTWAGDGTDNRNIATFGMDPAWCLVKSASTTVGVVRHSAHTGDQSADIDTGSGVGTDRIQAFITGGVQVGTLSRVNAAATNYHALGLKVGTATFAVQPAKLASGAVFRAPTLVSDVSLTPAFLASGRHFGTPSISGLANMFLATPLSYATFNTVGFDLRWTGTGGSAATCTMQYRVAGSPTWLDALPCWRVLDGTTKRFLGMVNNLSDNTDYEFAFTVGDGLGSSMTVYATASTREDNIPTSASFTVDRFVNPLTGSDAGDGTSRATAWRTLTFAIANTAAGGVIELAPGWYSRPTTSVTKQLTILAQYPAFDGVGTVINVGNHSIIYSGSQSAPAADTNPHTKKGQWVSVTFSGRQAWLWRYAGANGHGITNCGQLGYSATVDGEPQRVAHWKRATGFNTAALWVAYVYTNDSWRNGFQAVGSTDTSVDDFGVAVSVHDLLLVLPPNAPDPNPNNQYISVGGTDSSGNSLHHGLWFDGAAASNSRVNGVRVQTLDVGLRAGTLTDSVIFDRNLIYHCQYTLRLSQTAAQAPGTNAVVQENYCKDSNLWSTDQAGAPSIPWDFIKLNVYASPVAAAGPNRTGAKNEGNAVNVAGGSSGAVIRRNLLVGTFNGVGANNESYGTNVANTMDILGNTLAEMSDNPLEPETAVYNWWMDGNIIRDSLSVLSTAPAEYGTVRLTYNRAYNITALGCAADRGGRRSPTIGKYFKYDGPASPAALLEAYHNTFVTTNGDCTVGGKAGGSIPTHPFKFRNNIFIARNGDAFNIDDQNKAPGLWDEDYNLWLTDSASSGDGMQWGSTVYRTQAQVATYRAAVAASGNTSPAHSNRLGGVDVAFTDAATHLAHFDAQLAPLSTAPWLGAGVAVATFSTGAPDLGEGQFGTTVITIVGKLASGANFRAPSLVGGGLVVNMAGQFLESGRNFPVPALRVAVPPRHRPGRLGAGVRRNALGLGVRP